MTPRITFRRAALALACAGLSACAVVPNSGPEAEAILESAANPVAPYTLIDLSMEAVTGLEARERALMDQAFTSARPAVGRRLRVGDVVSVTIWEASGGGLFAPGLAESSGVSSRLPPQQVAASGRIYVPYAGTVPAAGRTPQQVGAAIVAALEGKAIGPQALVTIDASPGNAVVVSGDGGPGGRLPLMGVGERVLDAVAATGGISGPAHAIKVRLTRKGHSAEANLRAVLTHPEQNVPLRAGDVVALLKDTPTFTMFGAAAKPARVEFPEAEIFLDEAVALSGGVLDTRADPEGVFVFRYAPVPGGGTRAEVYRLNLREPAAFFLARRFRMLDKDIIYVADAPITDVQKVLGLIGQALSPVATGVGLARLAN